jgi:hypothetical protein
MAMNRPNGKKLTTLEDILDTLPEHQREWEVLQVETSVRSRLRAIRLVGSKPLRAALWAATNRRRYVEAFIRLKQIWNKPGLTI